MARFLVQNSMAAVAARIGEQNGGCPEGTDTLIGHVATGFIIGGSENDGAGGIGVNGGSQYLSAVEGEGQCIDGIAFDSPLVRCKGTSAQGRDFNTPLICSGQDFATQGQGNGAGTMVENDGLGALRRRRAKVIEINLHVSREDGKHGAVVFNTGRNWAPEDLELALDLKFWGGNIDHVYAGRVVCQEVLPPGRGDELETLTAGT